MAAFHAGDDAHQGGDGADAAGGAGEHDGVSGWVLRPGCRLVFEQADAAVCGVDLASGLEALGPVGGDDLEEFEGVGPVDGVVGADEAGEGCGEVDALAVCLVEEAGEFGGEQPGAVGGGGGAVLAVEGHDEAG